MIEIYMKNVTSKIDNLNDCLKKIIVNELSYTESGFGKKPKLISLFNSTMSTTYTGLIPHVIRVLNKFNIEYQDFQVNVKKKDVASGAFNKG